MSYHVRTSIGYIIGTVLVFGGYILYLSQLSQQGSLESVELSVWATAILVLIPAQIIVNAIATVVISVINTVITKEEDDTLRDERDKYIELRSVRNSYYVFMIGFLIGLGTLAFGQPAYVMFNVIVFALFLSQIFWNISQLFYYRRGY